MVVPFQPFEINGRRKLRPHKKSQRGCGNCRLRKVKCDESKPRCKRCTAYEVFCDFDCAGSELQLSIRGSWKIDCPRPPCSPNQTVSSVIDFFFRQSSTSALGINQIPQFKEQDLELLDKFQTRTVLTVSQGSILRLYQSEAIQLACSHPYLMHALLTLTLMHDRYLSAETTPKLSTSEAFHWYQATALYNSKLARPVEPYERYALWITACLLINITFCHVDAETPEDSWPLKPHSSSDLEWLKMTDGKREIWKMTEPMRADPERVYQTLAPKDSPPIDSSVSPGLDTPTQEFIALYGLDAPPTPSNMPYYAAASSLARSLNDRNIYSIILKFLSFTTTMRADYKLLLGRKDPRALILLAAWYTKVNQCRIWWIGRRATLECQAICLYIQRYHLNEPFLDKVVRTMCCGIASQGN